MSFARAIGRIRRPRRVWIWLALAAGIANVVYEYLSLHPHPFEPVATRVDRLSKQHGIAIGYGDPSKFFIAPYGPEDAKLEDRVMATADLENLPPALDGIEAALTVYPPGFVSSVVRGIFVGGEIRVGTETSGGFTAPAWFVLPASAARSSEDIRLTNLIGVHHELSSFVLRKSNVAHEWSAFAPKDWQFATASEKALVAGRATDPSPDSGFLSAYGATTAENDFNTYAERIFTQPEDLVRLACQHGLVRRKLLFVLQTYVTLDGRLDNPFRELGIDRARLCEQ
jgi:hypothetical protein